jgi:hypothetical protein
MRRDQLEHAIRAACQIAGLTEVIIVGSQAILGTYPETRLPVFATRSLEIDVLPIADDTGEIARLADEISAGRGLAGPDGQGSKREHSGALGRTSIHRVVFGQGGHVRCETMCAAGKRRELRRRPHHCGPC